MKHMVSVFIFSILELFCLIKKQFYSLKSSDLVNESKS